MCGSCGRSTTSRSRPRRARSGSRNRSGPRASSLQQENRSPRCGGSIPEFDGKRLLCEWKPLVASPISSPSLRSIRNFPLSRDLLSLATVPNDSLNLPPWRGIHERVEGEILVDESPAHEGARGLPEDRHRREVFPAFAPAGKSFLEFLEAQPFRQGSPPLPSLANGIREEDVHQGQQRLRVLCGRFRHETGNGQWGYETVAPRGSRGERSCRCHH